MLQNPHIVHMLSSLHFQWIHSWEEVQSKSFKTETHLSNERDRKILRLEEVRILQRYGETTTFCSLNCIVEGQETSKATGSATRAIVDRKDTSSMTIPATFALLLLHIVYLYYHKRRYDSHCTPGKWCHYWIHLTAPNIQPVPHTVHSN
jgi:hypothetical protein